MRPRSAAQVAIVSALALAPFACADHEVRDASSARNPTVVAIASSAPAPGDAVDADAASSAFAATADAGDAAREDMWGHPCDSCTGGLGLSGVGEGNDRDVEGIGLGNSGSNRGHGAGTTRSASDGGPWTSTPRIREGAVSVTGRLPPESVRHIVHQSFGRIRRCYEAALKKTPTLAGTVTTRFTVDASGAVSRAADDGSTLADKDVVSCIVRTFLALSFPRPESGIVVVSYPFTFAPTE